MQIFRYGDAETAYLRSRDEKLGEVIDAIGPIRREVYPDLFSALVHSIVGQQISAKAQITIWERMKGGLGEITPQAVSTRTVAEIQSFGITFKKAAHIRDAAARVLDGRLDIDALYGKTDAEFCRELIALDGVGVWTAEMLLLFSMQRPDVLSYGDLGILRGMRMLYHHEKITKELFEECRRRYSPYSSVASLYLWAVSSGAVEGLMDDPAK